MTPFGLSILGTTESLMKGFYYFYFICPFINSLSFYLSNTIFRFVQSSNKHGPNTLSPHIFHHGTFILEL